MFQCRSLDLPEWTEVDEVFNPISVRHLKPGQLHNMCSGLRHDCVHQRFDIDGRATSQASPGSSVRHLRRIML